jgi:hypothetical protein
MPLPAWCLTLSYGMPPPHRAIRILFLCTNLPFFGCGVALAARGHPYLGLVTALMGFVSGAFHFYQCLDGLNSQRVRYLLVADQACATVLVAANVGTASEWPSPLVWALGTVALLLLWWGTLRPNRGEPTAAPWSAAQQSLYAWTHGAWHLLICASSSLFVAQAHAPLDTAADDSGTQARAALSAAAVVSATGTGLFVLRGCGCGACAGVDAVSSEPHSSQQQQGARGTNRRDGRRQAASRA